MALIDTAFDTVKEAIGDVTDVAAESLETVGSALGDLASDERSRKGLVLMLLIAVLAVIGFVAWKKSHSTEGQGGELYSAPSRSATA
jgi:hypothetical protein